MPIPGYPRVGSTVSRPRTLLVPGDLLEEPALRAVNGVLARAGMIIVPPVPDSRSPGRGSGRPGRRTRVAVLIPRPQPGGHNDSSAGHPAAVNSWTALQALRAAASAGELAPVQESIRKISLEHLLTGRAIDFGDTLASASLLTGPPPRRSAAKCAARYGRRPVIAMLDNGVRQHPWLNVRLSRARGDADQPPIMWEIEHDGFVAVDESFQSLLYEEGAQAAAFGDRSRQLIRSSWDAPVAEDQPWGPDNDTGRGTFAAGIVRQVAPDAPGLGTTDHAQRWHRL